MSISDESRLAALVAHLSSMVARGGQVTEHHRFRAIVSMPDRTPIKPALLMSALGCVLFALTHGVVFLLAITVSLVSLHRSLVRRGERESRLVRVDDAGVVSERPM